MVGRTAAKRPETAREIELLFAGTGYIGEGFLARQHSAARRNNKISSSEQGNSPACL
jgi:hypothetical protein